MMMIKIVFLNKAADDLIYLLGNDDKSKDSKKID